MDLARIELIGRCGADAETRFMPDGRSVTSFSFAVGRRRKVSGELVSETDWYRVQCWGALGDQVQQFATKGARLYVAGRLSQRPWTDQSGAARIALECAASDVLALDRAPRAADAHGATAPMDNGDDFEEMPF